MYWILINICSLILLINAGNYRQYSWFTLEVKMKYYCADSVEVPEVKEILPVGETQDDW